MILTITLTTIVTILKSFWDGYTIEVKKRNFNHAWRNVLAGAAMIALTPLWFYTQVDYPIKGALLSMAFHFVFFDFIINMVRRYVYGNKSIKWYHLSDKGIDGIYKHFLGGNIYAIIMAKIFISALIFLLPYFMIEV
jgi:hypothetical protein